MIYIPMTDADLEIQAAATKDANFSGAWLDLGEGYAPGGLGESVGAVLNVTARDFTTGNETYSFVLQQTGPDADGVADASAAEAIGAAVAVTATGLAVVKGLLTKRFVRLVLTVGGTTPSITYSALLGK